MARKGSKSKTKRSTRRKASRPAKRLSKPARKAAKKSYKASRSAAELKACRNDVSYAIRTEAAKHGRAVGVQKATQLATKACAISR